MRRAAPWPIGARDLVDTPDGVQEAAVATFKRLETVLSEEMARG
jgi:hypothetical protein